MTGNLRQGMPVPSESHIQQTCVSWFRMMYPQLAPLLFHPANGRARDSITGAILKAEGVVPGVADLILMVPSWKWHGMCIEIKRPGGRQSKAQKEWELAVHGQGYVYVVCSSVDGFRREVQDYLGHGDAGMER
ncbi:MAG: VRR-NUC domain-containing protein [Prevotellaceae bacterium]|nr:VRR-NUC domain-containing protein [Prevotellaceae bacterium]